jgi:branched-chain amino acid transport system permease protein
MARLVQVVVDGIANGSIYAALALALVLIYRSTGIVNFAQGEMAMFSTFLTWGMTTAGVSLPLAILAALALSFGGGALLERIVIRPVEGRQPLTLVIVTLGLFILINNAAGWLWGFSNRGFPSTFPDGTVGLGGVRLSIESLAIAGVLLAVVGLLYLLFQRTRLGLAMRAAALDPVSSRLVGIRVGRMLMLGWAGRHGRRDRRHPGGAAAIPGRQPDGRRAGVRLRHGHPRRLRQRARRGARRLDHRREREPRRDLRGRDRLRPQDPGGAAGPADRAVRRQGGRARMSRPRRGPGNPRGVPLGIGWRWPRLVALVVVAVAAVSVPFGFPPFRVSQFTLALAYAVAALGLNLLVGYSGQISLGHGAFFALGAYSTAYLMARTGLPDLVAIPLAGVLAFAAGLLLGIPALRLRGHYLALVTLGVAVATPQLIKRFDGLTGGTQGLSAGSPAPPSWLGLAQDQYLYMIALVVTALALVMAANLVRGRVGRALVAIRSGEISARATGVNLTTFKLRTFALSAMLAGIGGTLYTYVVGFVAPESFTIAVSFVFLAAIVVGGLGTIAGAVFGALFIQFVPIYTSDVNEALAGVLYGGVLILFMYVLPGGVVGLWHRLFGWIIRPRRRRATGIAVAEEPELAPRNVAGV